MINIDWGAIYEQRLIHQDQRTDSYDKPTTDQAQAFVIEFEQKFPKMGRNQRLQIISDVVGRDVLSTYHLRVGEIEVLKQLIRNPQFVEAYNHAG